MSYRLTEDGGAASKEAALLTVAAVRVFAIAPFVEMGVDNRPHMYT